jgi:hypothetical protein
MLVDTSKCRCGVISPGAEASGAAAPLANPQPHNDRSSTTPHVTTCYDDSLTVAYSYLLKYQSSNISYKEP